MSGFWIKQVTALYRLELKIVTAAQSILLLVLRIYFGFQFSKGGWGKLVHIQSTTEFFSGLGIPLAGINAYLAGTVEFVGGICLFIGIGSRLITIPLIFTMLVAYATAHTSELQSIFANPNLYLKAPPFLFLLTSTPVLLFGPGCFSADWVIGKLVRNHARAPESPPPRQTVV